MLKIDEIEKGINYYCYVDEKFKFNTISISLIVDLEEEKASKNAVLCSLLRQSCKKYKNTMEMGKKLRSLYGADVFCDVKKAGNRQIIVFGVEVLDDEFAIEKEELTKKAIEFLLEILFNPNVENDEFPSKEVELEKKDTINFLQNIYSDKRKYAMKQAVKTLFEGKNFSVERLGSIKALEKISPKNLVLQYNELLSSSEILIVYVGHKEYYEDLEKIFDKFKKIKNHDSVDLVKKERYFVEKFKEKIEEDDLMQAKLIVGFARNKEDVENINFDDEIAIEVMNCLFGGSATSLLFSNVREKLSLCYYCSSSYDFFTGVIWAKSGVEGKNIEKAYREIISQLDSIKKGDFEEEELAQAKSQLEGVLEKTLDSESRILSYVLVRFLKNEKITPKEKLLKIKEVKKEDIVRVAKKFSVAIKYVLKGKEAV